jgi:hypothetical protein
MLVGHTENDKRIKMNKKVKYRAQKFEKKVWFVYLMMKIMNDTVSLSSLVSEYVCGVFLMDTYHLKTHFHLNFNVTQKLNLASCCLYGGRGK